MAISHAVRSLFPDKYETWRDRNKDEGRSRGGLAFRPPSDESIQILKPRQDDKIKHKWNPAEEEELMRMIEDTDWHYKGGLHDGSPCFPMIVIALNTRFHNGTAVISANACYRKYARLKNQQVAKIDTPDSAA